VPAPQAERWTRDFKSKSGTSFLKGAGHDVLYAVESHPIQSTVRVLFQLDAPQTTILQFWSDLQDRLAVAQSRLIYFQERNPPQALRRVKPTQHSFDCEGPR